MAGANLDLNTPRTGTSDLALGAAPTSTPAPDCSGTNLCLATPRIPGNANLSFGSGSTTPPSKNAVATADILLADITVDASCVWLANAVADVVMEDISIGCSVAYLVNVWRGPSQSTSVPHEQAAPIGHDLRSHWAPYVKLPASNSAAWGQAVALDCSISSLWIGLFARHYATAALWEQAVSIRNEAGTRWTYPPRQRTESALLWEQANPRQAGYASAWKYPPRAQTTRGAPFEQATTRRLSAVIPWDANPTRRRMETRIPWEQGRVLVSLWPRPDVYVPPVIPPRIITADLDLHCPVDGTANLKFGWLCGGDGGQIIIPIQRAYIVIHDIEVLRLPDNISIPASKVSISYDSDAWSWGWSATLLGKAALDAVLPSALGEPVTLAVNINGHIWHLVVEEWSESREFGKRGVSVKGRGLSSFLASPYILPASGLTTADRTLQQLMGDHLPIDSGASLTWTTGMADWLVPAGAWSWSNQAPINAIHAAAQAVGMVIVPGMASRVLHIQPRYPVMPWDFASATPGLVVPDTAILSANRRQAVPTQANAVYVHGGEVGGVLARVKRIYSAGDRVAATASSNLITHADAARHLGSRLLAAQYQQPALRDITMPMGGAFGLGAVGQLIAATIDNTEHRGIINAVSIDASMSDKSVSVRQTLTIGEETPNTWSRFKRLLPYDPLLLGTVEQNHPDGTTTVLMLGGGSTRVRGTATVGQAVYVRGGMIEVQAPSMAQIEIEV